MRARGPDFNRFAGKSVTAGGVSACVDFREERRIHSTVAKIVK